MPSLFITSSNDFMSIRAIVFLYIVKWGIAADVCVDLYPHKDVSNSVTAALAEPTSDSRQCLSRCLKLKDSVPCESCVYTGTKPSSGNGLCKMYTTKMTNLISSGSQSTADSTYYQFASPCSGQSHRLILDNSGNVMDIATGSTGTSNSGQGPGGYMPFGQWGAWNDWSTCSESCGSQGQQRRARVCQPPGQHCPGIAGQTVQCPSDQGCAEKAVKGSTSASATHSQSIITSTTTSSSSSTTTTQPSTTGHSSQPSFQPFRPLPSGGTDRPSNDVQSGFRPFHPSLPSWNPFTPNGH